MPTARTVTVDPAVCAPRGAAAEEAWRDVKFASPRDVRAGRAAKEAAPAPMRMGRARLASSNAACSTILLRLTGVEVVQRTEEALLVRVPPAVVRSLIALDKHALAAIGANAEAWFSPEFDPRFIEEYYRESTRQARDRVAVVPLARFALMPGAPVVDAHQGTVDMVLQLCGLTFQPRRTGLAWGLVEASVVPSASTRASSAFMDDDDERDDEVRIPDADLLHMEDDPDAWFDELGPGAEARAEMLEDLRSRLDAERTALERRLRDVDAVTAMADLLAPPYRDLSGVLRAAQDRSL